MDYKYTTTFECPISICKINEASLISEASLSNLAPLVPKDIDYKSNVDLLGVAFNAAVVNKFNRNGDGMDTATAKAYTPNFVHKPTNIEVKFIVSLYCSWLGVMFTKPYRKSSNFTSVQRV